MEPLRDNAVSSVTDAISRGRKRRANRRNVANDEIRIGPTTNLSAEGLAARGGPSKRRRTSLIAEEEEDDSNDEWEEQVEMDEDAVAAGVEKLKSEQDGTKKEENVEGKTVDKCDDRQAEREDVLEARKQRARMRANAQRKRVLQKHSVHLGLCVAHLMRLDAAASEEEVRGFALSIIPADVLFEDADFKEGLLRFALWLRAEFLVSARVLGKSRGGVCCVRERILRCVEEGRGDTFDIAAMVASMLRLQGMRCRIVSALQVVSWRMGKKERLLNKVTGKAKMVDATAKEWEKVIYAWVEVLGPDLKWIVLDVLQGVGEGAGGVEVVKKGVERVKTGVVEKEDPTKGSKRNNKRRSRRNVKVEEKEDKEPVRRVEAGYFTHVVAVEEGCVTDVTRRYTRSWAEVEKERAKGRVFERLLESFAAREVEKDEVYRKEIEEFDQLGADEAIPTSITALQRHPRYVLERHLKKYEVIWPKKPVVGHIKGEAIYLRANLHLLHTRDRWIRKMRIVKNGMAPMKVVKSMNGTDATVDLFGEWQTKELTIPECIDGKVPKGPHGNVDLWSQDHLPKGTVHVNLPYAKVAVRKLGIDFAPAMVGFEIRGGRSVPKIEGVVVAEENEDLVKDAARSTAETVMKRQNERAKEEALVKWLKLLRAVKAREQVRKKYGGMFDEVGTWEAMQKKEGQRKAKEEKEGKKQEVERSDQEMKDRREAIAKRTQAHEHIFGNSRCLEGDTWVKTCEICGLDVQFEQL